MTGLPATRLVLDLPDEPRAALVIATTTYQDPDLRQLRAPAHDAEDLAEVLGDPRIGGFTVTQVLNHSEGQVRREIDAFLSGRGTDDLVVVYLSCHGVLDRRNRLYFAATDTFKTQLNSTGIPSGWLMDLLQDCRARRQVLILDCCFSGAFAHGSKGDNELDLERRLTSQGRGRAVLTASRAGEYSFEGQALDDAEVSGSVFTAGLVEGLRTGDADVGSDGYVSLDEAYDYAYSYVQSSGVGQTPQRWLYGGEGTIVLARSPMGAVITPTRLPQKLTVILDSPYPQVRISAINVLSDWLIGDDPARALAAEQALRQIADTEVPAVAAAARAVLPTTMAAEPQDVPVPEAAAARPNLPEVGPPSSVVSSQPPHASTVDVDQSTIDALVSLTLGDIEKVENLGLGRMTPDRSGLDARTFSLVTIAALVAVDAPPPSHLWEISSALDRGVTPQNILGVLYAIARDVDSHKLVSAAPNIMVALDLALPEGID
jgi:hypothetical protein